MLLAEGAEGGFAGPAVDGEVVAGYVEVAEHFGAVVLRRGAKELRPRAVRAIGCFKGGYVFLGYFELPNHDEHAMRPESMVAQRGRFTLCCGTRRQAPLRSGRRVCRSIDRSVHGN